MKKIRNLYKNIKGLYFKYERRVSSVALIFGFIFDSLTLKRVDLFFEQIILFSHLCIVWLAIVYINFYEQKNLIGRGRISYFFRHASPVIMQFSFGALFSGFLIFYIRSASMASSWLFLFFLVFLLVGNEFFRKRYQRFTFQISVFYFTLFSFLIFYVPVLVGKIGVPVFILSGCISLIMIIILIKGIFLISNEQFKQSKKYTRLNVLGIFIIINILYFLNIIPPIPLSLKDSEVVHMVNTNDGAYLLKDEEKRWYQNFLPYDIINKKKESPVYFFSSVFAPTNLTTTIVHRWEYKNQKGEWITHTKISFPVVGGRDGGYRGYSFSRTIKDGWWRVSVETSNGQVLGVKRFKVIETIKLPYLKTYTY